MGGNLLQEAFAAFMSGRGYAARSDLTVPGTDIRVDVAAVLPRMRDLKTRLRRGFVPTGILHPLIGAAWVSLREIVRRTGYPPGYVAAVLEEAARERWVELDMERRWPRCRLLDYRPPARECVLAFDGTEGLAEKMDRLKALDGSYSRAQFLFPFDVDEKTTEAVASLGAGVVRYHRGHGVFQETVPAESCAIEDPGRFALIVEYVLYDHIWIRTTETL